MIFRKTFGMGILLIFLGLFVPSAVLIGSLRHLPADSVLSAQLLLGATLFKAGLITLGLVLIVLNTSRIREKIGWTENSFSHEYPQSKDPYTILLFGLLILSLAVRLYRLGEGLWLDEIGMCLKYLRRPFGELLTTYDSENQHFLYTILAHICRSIFGENGWTLRFPAVLFGVASIWALYLLGKEVTSRREAFLSATLLSLSYYHVWFSQNARGYTGLLFWTLFSSWFFVRALASGAPRLWIGYAVTVALGVFTQFVMVFVTAAHFLIYLYYVFVRQPKLSWKGFFLGFCLVGLFSFQLYAIVLPQFFGAIGMKGTVAAWNSPLWTLRELIRGMKVSFAGSFVALAALLVFLAGIWSYARSKPVLLSLLILPPLLGSIVVVAMGHPLWPRFYFFTFGFGTLIVVRGGMILGRAITRLLPRVTVSAETAGTLVCGCLILISTLSIPAAYLPKQDFLGALSFVEKDLQPGDAVVTVGRIAIAYNNYYRTNFIEVKSLAGLDNVRNHAKRTWLLYMIPADVQFVYPDIWAAIQTDFRVVKTFPSPLADGAIFVSLTARR